MVRHLRFLLSIPHSQQAAVPSSTDCSRRLIKEVAHVEAHLSGPRGIFWALQFEDKLFHGFRSYSFQRAASMGRTYIIRVGFGARAIV